MEDILNDFIDWARDNSIDAFEMYEDQDKFIARYLKYIKEEE